MIPKQILIAYKEGRMSTAELQERLSELQHQVVKSPISEGQKGLWMLQKMSPAMSAYNIPLCLRFGRKLDADTFKEACRFVLEQHPILSSVIGEDDGVPYLLLQPTRLLPVHLDDISHLEPLDVIPYLRKKSKEPFSLDKGPLIRIHLLSRSGQQFFALIVIHHIIFDGVSVMPLMTTLLKAYQAFMRGEHPSRKPVSATYGDFVKWEQKMLSSGTGEEHRMYWKRQLSGILPILELPTDRPRPGSQTFQGHVHTHRFSPNLSQKIKDFAQSYRIKPSVVFLGILKVLLHRYTGQHDIIIGMPTLGRPQERFDFQIGFFVNMVALRSHVAGDQPFSQFLSSLQLTMVDALDHAIYPFPVVVRELELSRTLAASPVFQVSFAYQNFLQSTTFHQLRDIYSNALDLELLEELHQEGEYEFGLEVFENRDGFALNFKYNPDLFDSSTIIRLAGHYIGLTEEIIKNPGLTIDEFPLLSEEEKKCLLIDWNATQTDYPRDKCVHHLFAEQAKKIPDAIAVCYEDSSLTYRELDERSTTLGIYLQGMGVQPDSLVGICVERSLDMIVGLMGILKAGGAYVPLDPDYPTERLEHMFQDSKMPIVLTQSSLTSKLSPLLKTGTAIVLDKQWEYIEQTARGKDLNEIVRPDNLAYVLYTSGSTGKPKGVMISHASLTNFLVAMKNQPGLNSNDRLLAVTTYSFDIAGLELYLPLINGAQCVVCNSDKTRDAEKLKQEIVRVRPTIMQATPVTWKMLFQTGWQNEEKVRILCGGEALPEGLKQDFIKTNSEVWNMFGPTETTIWSTVERVKEGEPTTIGKPIANTQVYILDNNLRPTPIGVPGELCIAGDGVARGYLHRPDLTDGKFIVNPFKPGTKLYRTGDLARWLPNGSIEFLGRLDHQVKIRGFRIELKEIETQLNTHPEIENSVVIVKEHAGVKQLIAYYILKNHRHMVEVDQQSQYAKRLRNHLKLCLPEYMIPSLFISLDEIPLTPNGKIDRKKLASREVESVAAEQNRAPLSEIERQVLELWTNVLPNRAIGTEDGFFEVGGDSFSAVTVAERIKKHFNCDFPVTTLFKYPNIKDISKYIAETKEEATECDREQQENSKPAAVNSIQPEHPFQKSRYSDYYQNSLAIIGMSCHFPGATDHLEFWNNLKKGKESVTFFSKEEIRRLNVPENTIQNPHYIPVRSTIEGKDLFDPRFFNIAPRDAEFMDPQLRLLLLHSWKAIEDAGYVPNRIPETSVFMSASNGFYQALLPSFNVMENADQYVTWILAQGGTIPTIISHKLGLKGPSFFVHSNCSSSLAGLYSAYQSLKLGEAKYALVGAATLFPSPSLGYVHQAGLNFSSDGHCKTFDASADGMIGGEGVAVVVLKKAIDAARDGDHIYALLRGISINNDGADKVGFYAPSVKGQAEVIRKALESTKINPESISYIEAHGTGTKLGDPIELAALNDIYRQYTAKKQFCGIGSVKTNIGHLDTAAGLAGCIKVALSLYHREIPPSINYRKPNPNIDFSNSPFYVVDTFRKWESTSLPRRAALSSFGIGGTNSHAIFEEHAADCQSQQGSLRQPDTILRLVPLSAKNRNRLKASARQLLHFLENHYEYHHTLHDIAFTLQIGREAMESRVVFIVDTIGELIKKLKDFVDGEESFEGCYSGEARKSNDALEFEKDEHGGESIARYITSGEVKKIAELWVKGFRLDWESLYGDSKPRRISLPTYPFATERYWMPEAGRQRTENEGGGIGDRIHPLLHQNTSDFAEQRFSSTFTGREFFLADHVVKGRKIFPAVAYLEMARAAIARAVGLDEDTTTIRLKNIVWARPVVVNGQPVNLHIGLLLEDNGEIAYEIYSGPDGNGGKPIIHSQGKAVVSPITEVPTLNLSTLQAQCRQKTLSSDQCYEAFKMAGIEYGPGHRGIDQLQVGSGHVLAKLSLPVSVSETKDPYVLHPSLMDSALQAQIGLMLPAGDSMISTGPVSLKPSLPFALEELEIFGKRTSTMWAYCRPGNGSKAGDAVQKLDIDLCDDQGNLCARMKGFSTRVLEGELQAGHDLQPNPASATESGQPARAVMLMPVWDVCPVVGGQPFPSARDHVVIIGTEDDGRTISRRYPKARLLDIHATDGVEAIVLKLASAGPIDHIFWVGPHKPMESVTDESLILDQDRGVIQVFRIIKSLLQLGYGSKKVGWSVLTFQSQPIQNNDSVSAVHASVHGLIGSMAKEYPNWKVRLVEMQGDAEWPIEDLFSLSPDSLGNAWGHREGEWYRQKLIRIDLAKTCKTMYKNGGVYVVIGGAGGVGKVWSEYMIRTYQARIIWIGRRQKDAAIQAKLDELGALGVAPLYISSDATDQHALQRAYEEIKKRYHRIHGVIHSAIVLMDQSLANMDEDRFRAGLSAKVDVSLRMAQVFQKESLDFILFFSSINAFTKAPGQSNYVAGCTFMDAFARQLSQKWQCAVKVMNWGYWGDVGVVASEEYRKRMADLGIGSIDPPEAMEAMETLLSAPIDQIALMKSVRPH